MSLPELIVAGNWKMNGVRADLAEIAAVREGTPASSKAGVWIFPPATLISAAAALSGGADVLIGAQDCHAKDWGAFTGDLSGALLKTPAPPPSSWGTAKGAADMAKRATRYAPRRPRC